MRLFRYINDKHLEDILDKQYFYCSKPKEVDDIFDCELPFNCKIENDGSITNDTIKQIISESLEYIFLFGRGKIDYGKLNKILQSVELKGVTADDESDIYSLKDIDPKLIENTKLFEIWEARLTSNHYISFFKDFIVTIKRLVENIRICCFSKNNDNLLMWGLYADKFKGYCIEYEIEDNISSNIKKIIYTDRYRFDPLKVLIKDLMSIIEARKKISNVKIANKIESNIDSLIKSKDKQWKFQKEYRYISVKGKEYIPCKITSVFIGNKVDPEKANEIFDKYKSRYNIMKMKIDHWNQIISFLPMKCDIKGGK